MSSWISKRPSTFTLGRLVLLVGAVLLALVASQLPVVADSDVDEESTLAIPEPATTSPASSPIQFLSTGNIRVLKVDLRDSRVGVRVGLANGDDGGYQSLSGMKSRYSGQGYAEWALINGDVFGRYDENGNTCPVGVNCAQGLTFIDGAPQPNWSAYKETWRVRGNIGFDGGKDVQVSIGNGQTKRHMTIAGGPWIVKDGGPATCQSTYDSGRKKTHFSTGEEFDDNVTGWCIDTRGVTMVGYSQDRRYLFMGVSTSGMNVIQLGNWLKQQGAHDVLRLDSGDSSGMYYNGTANGKIWREIPNHLAIIVRDGDDGGDGEKASWNAKFTEGDSCWWDTNCGQWVGTAQPKCEKRIDGTGLNLDLGTSAPCGNGMSGDNWVGNFETTVEFGAGNYVFRVEHDDGFKLWLDGQNIADFGGSGKHYTCPARSLSGKRKLRAMLREEGGDARVQLSWTTDTSVCYVTTPTLKSPPDGSQMKKGAGVTLCWNNAANASAYLAEYRSSAAGGSSGSSNWQGGNCWNIGVPKEGYTYTWHVRSRNANGVESGWSPIWSFSVVAPTLELVEPLSLLPSRPLVGEETTARFRVRNESSKAITLQRLLVGIHGPDCATWECSRVADFIHDEDLTLQPGQTYTYEHTRVFTGPGQYMVIPLYVDSAGRWHSLADQTTFTVAPGLTIAKTLFLSPLEPRKGETVIAQFTLKNLGTRVINLLGLGVASRGPDCTNWECAGWADFPAIRDISLKPQETYHYSAERSFHTPGGGYFAEPALVDSNDWWYPFPDDNRVAFTVSPGLEMVEALSFSPPNPLAGEETTARFQIRNASNRPFGLQRLLVGVHGPDCADWECSRVADFYHEENLTLEPGQTHTYEHSRIFPEPGKYMVVPLYVDSRGNWHSLADQTTLTVSPGLAIVQSLSLSSPEPRKDEVVTAQYTLKNLGGRAISVQRLGLVARGPNCDNWECAGNADFPAVRDVTLQPHQEYHYSEKGSFHQQGEGYFAEPAYADSNNWWYPFPGDNRATFSVSPGLELVEELSLSPTEPRVGEEVQARFAIRNDSGKAINLQRLLVGVHGPDCAAWECSRVADFYHEEDLTLQPGQKHVYSYSRVFAEPGEYMVVPLYVDNDGYWHSLAPQATLTVHSSTGNGPTLRIPERLAAHPGSTLSVPVHYSSESVDIASTTFSINFDQACLSFDPTDNNQDGIPDSVVSHQPSTFGLTVNYDSNDADGELDIFLASLNQPLGTLVDGKLVSVSFEVVCEPEPDTMALSPIDFSNDPPASFGDTSGRSVQGVTVGGSAEIQRNSYGDCNSDHTVDAGDISALVLEIFDGDGMDRSLTPGGTFTGSPNCDANGDSVVDAGDISCTVLTIFGGMDACTRALAALAQPRAAGPVSGGPSLQVPVLQPTESGGTVTVPITFTASGQDISSLVFSIDYAQEWLSLHPEDRDEDGIPDSVSLDLPTGFQAFVTLDQEDEDGELDVFIGDLTPPLMAYPSGAVLYLTFSVGDAPASTAGQVRFSDDPPASFGSVAGQSVQGHVRDGSIFIDGRHKVFLPVVMRQP